MSCWEVAEQGFQPRLPEGSCAQTGSRQLAELSEDWALSVPRALGKHWRREAEKSKLRIIVIKVTCGLCGGEEWMSQEKPDQFVAESSGRGMPGSHWGCLESDIDHPRLAACTWLTWRP